MHKLYNTRELIASVALVARIYILYAAHGRAVVWCSYAADALAIRRTGVRATVGAFHSATLVSAIVLYIYNRLVKSNSSPSYFRLIIRLFI